MADHRKWRTVLWLVSGVVLAMALRISGYRRSSLLSRATRVIDLRANGGPGITSVSHYFWLTPTEILLAPADGCPVYRYSIAMHSTTVLPALTALFKKSHEYSELLKVSPDGQHLLWKDLSGSHGTYSATLQGSDCFRYGGGERDWREQIHWLPDSKHWIELLDDNDTGVITQAIVHSVRHSVNACNIKVGPGRDDWNALLRFTTIASVNCFDAIQIYGHDSVMEGNLSMPAHAEHKMTIPIRPGFLVYGENVQLSPKHERIAWAQTYDDCYPFSAVMHRLLPIYNPRTHHILSIWVSRLDGTHKHEVAREEMTTTLNFLQLHRRLRALQWTPDGQHLSFIRENVLYSIPAD